MSLFLSMFLIFISLVWIDVRLGQVWARLKGDKSIPMGPVIKDLILSSILIVVGWFHPSVAVVFAGVSAMLTGYYKVKEYLHRRTTEPTDNKITKKAAKKIFRPLQMVVKDVRDTWCETRDEMN